MTVPVTEGRHTLGRIRPGSPWASWSAFIVRPSVALTIPWVGVCALVTIFRLAVFKFPVDPAEVVRLVSPTEFVWVTVMHGALLLGLLFEGRKALSSPRDLRRAHLVTTVLAIGLIIMLQVFAVLARGPIDAPFGH